MKVDFFEIKTQTVRIITAKRVQLACYMYPAEVYLSTDEIRIPLVNELFINDCGFVEKQVADNYPGYSPVKVPQLIVIAFPSELLRCLK
jgi:hypothetical protein